MFRIPRTIYFSGCLAVLFFVWMGIMRGIIYFHFKPTEANWYSMLSSFWMGSRYDAREISILCLLLLLMGCVPALHPFATKKGKVAYRLLLLLFIATTTIMYVIDFLHFNYLRQRLNASAWGLLEDGKLSTKMVWQTYPVLTWLLVIIIITTGMYWVVKRIHALISKLPFINNRKTTIIAMAVGILLCAVGIFGRIGQYPLRWSDAFNLGDDFKANIALNPFQSFFSSLTARKSTYNIQKVKQYYPLLQQYLQLPPTPDTSIRYARNLFNTQPPDTSALLQPNIVLIICESFSAYKSSMWGNPLNATPYFNSLCQQGIFFDNCFTPHIGTARGVWATLTGIPDVELNKTASRNARMVNQHTIINEFKGYEKLYFLGGSSSWANIRGLLTNNIRGLRLYEEGSYKASAIDVWGISDKNLFLEAHQVLKQEQHPFFAVIQTADNHRPYTIPKEDEAVFKKIKVPAGSLHSFGFESNDELNAFRYTDFCFEQFIEAAKKEKYFNRTIFVFVGDHGIAGNAGNMFPPAWTANGLTAYHVPLLFFAPGLHYSPQRIHAIASQVDVLPTIAALAKLSHYTNTTLGKDLLQQWKQDSGRSNKAFIIDHNNKTIGLVSGDWYFTESLEGQQKKMLPANWLHPNHTTTASDSLFNNAVNYTHAFYETAKYWLLENKKQQK
jgi:phosphoglycerol transferase MdoB-like AlkP superfamily enzyme